MSLKFVFLIAFTINYLLITMGQSFCQRVTRGCRIGFSWILVYGQDSLMFNHNRSKIPICGHSNCSLSKNYTEIFLQNNALVNFLTIYL